MRSMEERIEVAALAASEAAIEVAALAASEAAIEVAARAAAAAWAASEAAHDAVNANAIAPQSGAERGEYEKCRN